jgi:hypothetical protein
MDMNLFTVEEENLICIYDTRNRQALINELNADMHYFDEIELREITMKVLEKLSVMTDGDFSAYIFHPSYDSDDEEV